MKMNCSQCGYDCLGCFQRLQQNVEEQAKIILKRNFRIIEFSQRVGKLEKQLAEAQAEIKSQDEEIADAHNTIGFMQEGLDRWKVESDALLDEVERLKDNISTGDFVYKAVSRQRDDFREASECFLRTWKRAGPLGSHQFEKFDRAVQLAEIALDAAKGEKGGAK